MDFKLTEEAVQRNPNRVSYPGGVKRWPTSAPSAAIARGRWVAERTGSWINRFRHLPTGWERASGLESRAFGIFQIETDVKRRGETI
jgi:hypothetical protein